MKDFEVKFVGQKNIYKAILYNGYFDTVGKYFYFLNEAAAEQYLNDNSSTFTGQIKLEVHTVVEFGNGNMYVLGEAINIS